VALVVVSAVMLWGMTHRAVIDLHVLRDRNPTFVTLHDGAIRNGYTLKIANRGFTDETAEIRFAGVPNVRMKTPGAPSDAAILRVEVPANEIRAVRVFVTAPTASIAKANMPASFEIHMGKSDLSVDTTFLSGAANAR
jgi:polyferredoxin